MALVTSTRAIFKKRNMKLTGWIFAAVAVIIIIYLQLCSTKPAQQTAPDPLIQELKQQQADTIHYYEELLKAGDAALDLAVTTAEQSGQRANSTEAELLQSKDNIQYLSGELKKYRPAGAMPHGVDDEWLSVSPGYINTCDSLDAAALRQNAKIDSYVAANNDLSAAVATQKKQYDTSIAGKNRYITALKSLVAESTTRCDSALQKAKERRTQLWAGMTLLGQKNDLLNGGLITLTLATKKNLMVNGCAGLVNGQQYFGAGVKVLVSFRKK